uniref:Uncharacterized protein n=1 Tax=Oryza barthii TaxID=65489 RepID=A0A0D3FMS5_9ORYZ
MDPPVHAAELNHRNNYGPLSSPNPISLRIRARLSLARAREPVAAAAASSSSSEEPEPQRRRAPPPIGRPLGEREREIDRVLLAAASAPWLLTGNGILVGYSDGGFAGRLGFREPDRGRGGGELIRGGGGGGGGENMW